jgi:hypothetical protein
MWALPSENNAHKKIHGTAQVGEKNPRAKLTENDVRKIRGMRGKLERQEIADLFDVSLQCVKDILYGKTWRYLI